MSLSPVRKSRSMADVEQAAGTDHWASIIRRAKKLDAEAFDVVVDAYGGRLAGFFSPVDGQRRRGR